MKTQKSLIACPIFKEELGMLLPPEASVTTQIMDYRIHIDSKRMKAELNATIATAKDSGGEVCLLLGCECDCDTSIKEMGAHAQAKHPLEKNCLEIILGPERARKLQQNRTSIITRGWMKMVTHFIESGVWNEVDARINFGHHDRLLLLDYGADPISDEEIISFYDLVQVPIEIERVELDYFQDALKRLLDE